MDNAFGLLRHSRGALRVIVLGYIVRGPLGGLVWHHLQYMMGLAHLGHDVYFVEDSGDSTWCCYDPKRQVTDADPSYGLEFARDAFGRVGLGERWAYYDAHTTSWRGPCASRILDVCASADLLLNLGGVNPLRPWLRDIPARALVDTDPVFTQVRHLTDSGELEQALQHTAFFSFGENIGLSRCGIPDDGLPWQTTRQPVVLTAWPTTPGPAHGEFTTVMQWDSYPPREYKGRYYGMKSASFSPYLDLPKKAGHALEVAVGGPTTPVDLLRSNGWMVRDSLEPTRDPWTYQRYLQRSKAEFSVAKHGYVVSRSGWFSERSAVYLASGRPVLTQETGFSDWLEVGSGIIPFASPDEALAGIDTITGSYPSHCKAARAIAEEYFDAGKVLPSLIERALSSTYHRTGVEKTTPPRA